LLNETCGDGGDIGRKRGRPKTNRNKEKKEEEEVRRGGKSREKKTNETRKVKTGVTKSLYDPKFDEEDEEDDEDSEDEQKRMVREQKERLQRLNSARCGSDERGGRAQGASGRGGAQ